MHIKICALFSENIMLLGEEEIDFSGSSTQSHLIESLVQELLKNMYMYIYF